MERRAIALRPATPLARLVDLLRHAPGRIFIQPHNVPDPDAIASCAGLRYLLARHGIQADIVYDREIEKIDALKLLEMFAIDMIRVEEAGGLGGKDWAVLVDCQKGMGNVTDLATEEVAVIDHHEIRSQAAMAFADIRPAVGACATIIAEYFFANHIDPPTNLATALLFGIMKDTDSLTRAVSDLDMEMFYQLYRHSDMKRIQTLNGNQLTMEDLAHYAEAFQTVEVRQEVGFMRLDCSDDALLGAASDIVLSLDCVQVVVAHSMRPAGVKLSIRSETAEVKANALVRFLLEGTGFGGGHDHMAGGFLPRENIPPGQEVGEYIKGRTQDFLAR